MPKMHVDRQWTIRAEAGKVFDVIADYGTWTTWSPWLCADKGASVTVSDPANQVGSTYAWDGDVVGAGSMTHTQLKTPDEIVAKLEFTKPFKSTSQVTFKIRPQGDATVVEWHMDGNWPWFLFWMKGMMETLIGMDYQRGLMMLGDWIETGKIESDTEVLGVVDVPDRTVHGVSNQVAMADVGESMAKDFHRV
ncbi:MAG: SRPBCC family protein, partial [Planctomycetota bacterium]